MDFLKGAANKYLNSDDKPTTAAHPGANIGGQGGNGGGLEWENLARLTDQYSYLDKNKDGTVDAKDFLGFFGGSSGTSTHAAPPAQLGKPPAGYPTSDGKPGNPNVINQLLNKFQQDQGQQFQGTDTQWQILSKIATALTGKEIPIPILKKLVQWKLGGSI